MKKTLIVAAGLLCALNLSGCVLSGGGGYHYDHGDLVSNDGTIRYVGWCRLHPRNSHCLDTHVATATAGNSGVVPAPGGG
jgi:hypothetical protein